MAMYFHLERPSAGRLSSLLKPVIMKATTIRMMREILIWVSITIIGLTTLISLWNEIGV